MTSKQLDQQLSDLKLTVDFLSRVVTDFVKESSARLEQLENKVDKKHLPVNLEKDILQITQESIAKSIQAVLINYNSPLNKLVESVVSEQSAYLRQIISDSFSQVIKTEDFKRSIIDAFSHKVARTIISNNDGLFDKVSNELKNSPEFKSRMTLAVVNVVNECLREKGMIKDSNG